MALATTTLSSACAQTDTSIVLTSATSIASGRSLIIDSEEMVVAQGYVSGTTVNVLRGRGGTAQVAHKVTANVTHGLASDFSTPSPSTTVTYPAAGRARVISSITAVTSTMTLPPAGCDAMVILNGTSAITLTVPVPTKDMDGTILYLVSNGVAAHVPTFTGGLGGVGTGYTAFTVATGAPLCIMCVAVNGAWNIQSAPAWTGTVTKLIGGIA